MFPFPDLSPWGAPKKDGTLSTPELAPNRFQERRNMRPVRIDDHQCDRKEIEKNTLDAIISGPPLPRSMRIAKYFSSTMLKRSHSNSVSHGLPASPVCFVISVLPSIFSARSFASALLEAMWTPPSGVFHRHICDWTKRRGGLETHLNHRNVNGNAIEIAIRYILWQTFKGNGNALTIWSGWSLVLTIIPVTQNTWKLFSLK